MELQALYQETLAITSEQTNKLQAVYDAATNQIVALRNETALRLTGVDVAQLQAENATLKSQLGALQPPMQG